MDAVAESVERSDSPFKLVTTSGVLVKPTSPPKDMVRVFIEQDGPSQPQLVVTNRNQWSEQIEIVWQAEAPRNTVSRLPEAIFRFDEDTFYDSSERPAKSLTRWRFEIAANSTTSWVWKERASNIVRWDSKIAPSALAKFENQLTQLSQSLSQLTTFQAFENVPPHGNFETIEAGRLVPTEWSTSLTPSAEWSVYRDLYRSGTQSLQFQNQRAGTKGWLQSPAIAMPSDGRIAAAVWISIDQAVTAPTITATTALINREGERSEWQHQYKANDLARNGDAWQRIDFPILTKQSIGNLEATQSRVRFTLDIDGITKLWVDDFFAGRVFLDEIERRELRSALYVARRELSQSRPHAAWELVQSDTFRYVLENAPKSTSGSEGPLPRESVYSTPRVEPRKALFDNPRRRIR
jgi:hypothetical protein